jgi:hypothetical protein
MEGGRGGNLDVGFLGIVKASLASCSSSSTSSAVSTLPRLTSSSCLARRVDSRYEIALCIQTGDIVWINGPFPCGNYNDLTIFRSGLMSELANAERVEADDGYIGEHPQHVKCPAGFANPPKFEYMQQIVTNRQETVNNRLKFWSILKQLFRHYEFLCRHGVVVRAILVVTQIAINQGERLFPCGYKNPPFTTAGNINITDSGYDDYRDSDNSML